MKASGLLGLAAALFLIAACATEIPTTAPTQTTVPTPFRTPTPSVIPLNAMVKQVRPAVVRIQAGSGGGSGAIFETVGQTGYVITNYHVVEGFDWVNVVVNDSATYRGLVVGADNARDLAVVGLCCGHFQTVSFEDSSNLEAGDEVVNIGYALGIQGEATVTKGIVSAIRYDSEYQSWVIQSDAAMNSGNSGGPMLSLSGGVLGINTYVYSDADGLGFAISEQTVQQLIPALRSDSLAPTPTPTPRQRQAPGAPQPRRQARPAVSAPSAANCGTTRPTISSKPNTPMSHLQAWWWKPPSLTRTHLHRTHGTMALSFTKDM